MSHTEQTIIEALDRRFDNCQYKVANAYIFRSYWESDFFIQRDNKYTCEFEVKISRVDFFHDSVKKKKHIILGLKKEPTSIKVDGVWRDIAGKRDSIFMPNKFYYAVPEGLISAEEIPKYAGLIYVGKSGTNIIKEAPFLHKKKFDFEKKLCIKFYHYWKKLKYENSTLKRDLEFIKERTQLKKEL